MPNKTETEARDGHSLPLLVSSGAVVSRPLKEWSEAFGEIFLPHLGYAHQDRINQLLQICSVARQCGLDELHVDHANLIWRWWSEQNAANWLEFREDPNARRDEIMKAIDRFFIQWS